MGLVKIWLVMWCVGMGGGASWMICDSDLSKFAKITMMTFLIPFMLIAAYLLCHGPFDN